MKLPITADLERKLVSGDGINGFTRKTLRFRLMVSREVMRCSKCETAVSSADEFLLILRKGRRQRYRLSAEQCVWIDDCV